MMCFPLRTMSGSAVMWNAAILDSRSWLSSPWPWPKSSIQGIQHPGTVPGVGCSLPIFGGIGVPVTHLLQGGSVPNQQDLDSVTKVLFGKHVRARHGVLRSSYIHTSQTSLQRLELVQDEVDNELFVSCS